MEKLRMQTKDLNAENIKKLEKLFPEVITEVESRDKYGMPFIKKTVDFDALKEALGEFVEGKREKYQLTWPGKQKSKQKIGAPVNKTLRPVKEESVDWDNTKNLYIEGDNFEVLKLLQESYLNKVKMIYIDPPYNTGKDFVYNDNFTASKQEYAEEAGLVDEEGQKLFKPTPNTDTNGRFHSDWLSMMYERLKIARDFLTEDGVIFMSIDDNEVANLRKIADEIFGEDNFVAEFIRSTGATRALAKNFDIRHDYVLIFAKDKAKIKLNEIEKDNSNYINPDNDKNGAWSTQDFSVRGGGNFYEIPSIDFSVKFKKSWAIPEKELKENMGGDSKSSYKELYEKAIYIKEKNWYVVGKYVFKGKKNIINAKKYANNTSTLKNNTLYKNIGSNKSGSSVVKKLFNVNVDYFDKPKPIELLKYLVFIATNKNDIILDFFSGSATTAHAVMQLNAEDGGNRRFIMVQLPEATSEDSEAFKAGFKSIPEIGRERIRRAGKKIISTISLSDDFSELEKIKLAGGGIAVTNKLSKKGEEKIKNTRKIDVGFRTYRLDESNMKDVFYHPSEIKQTLLTSLESSIKEDRIGLDLLTQVMLELGLTLDLPIEEKQINGKTVYYVAGNSLVACFEDNLSKELIEILAKEKPIKVVFKDSAFASDSERINLEETFKSLSSSTTIKVL